MPKVGRPSKYTKDVQAKADTYLDVYEETSVIPSVVGLAVFLGIPTSTMYRWAADNEEFRSTLDVIKDNQHLKALNGGLDSTYNSTITKLVLANFGYSEKTQTELTGPKGGPVQSITRTIVKADGS